MNRPVYKIGYCILLISLLVMSPAIAQERLGMVNGKYSGINGALINPALTVTSPFYLDVNLVSAGLFLDNNYIYLAKDEYQFRRFLSLNPDLPTHPPDNKFYYDYYTPPSKKGSTNMMVMGPSALLVMGRQAFGLYTAARSYSYTRNVPFELAKFMYEGLTFPPQYDIEYVHENAKLSAASLNWAELGINYSYIARNQEFGFLSFGVNLKMLKGYAGGYVNSDMIDYMVPDRDTLVIYHVNWDGGIALPMDYQNNLLSNSPLFRGNGWGLDLGVVYEQKLRSTSSSFKFRSLCSQSYAPYKFRIGFSILDIGRIRFSTNAMQFQVNDGNLFWPGINHSEFANVNDLIGQISSHFYGNTNQLIVGNEIKIGLPTALSLQGDYNIRGNFYINGTAVYPIRMFKPSVMRYALVALAPRYDSRNFGFGVVASLYDWEKFHFGLNARFRGIFIGTEMLGSFFHFTDFTGIDIYGGIKFSLLKGHCRGSANTSCGNNEYVHYQKKGRKIQPRNK